jgi:imidazole glycerol-phosphate synthase subunit HisH
MAISIIDYGVGNVRSVVNAVSYIGCEVNVSCDVRDIEKADGIILPGVGACGYAMEVLGELAETISKVALAGKPLLGICLGFQLLFDESLEHGRHKCLGLIDGQVVPIPPGRTIPHMGWNKVEAPDGMGLFEGLEGAKHFAFAHSYYAAVTDPATTVAYADYGIKISASVQKGNIFGCQFHPEKSGPDGLAILRNFQRLCERAND